MVGLGNRAADEHLDVAGLGLAQPRRDLLDQLAVAARQDAQADRVDALVDRDPRDLLRALAQPRVDHLGAGVAQRERDDLRPDVVPVEAGLGDQDPLAAQRKGRLDGRRHRVAGVAHSRTGSWKSPHCARSRATISPTVAYAWQQSTR
jgi:hypothetical protein